MTQTLEPTVLPLTEPQPDEPQNDVLARLWVEAQQAMTAQRWREQILRQPAPAPRPATVRYAYD